MKTREITIKDQDLLNALMPDFKDLRFDYYREDDVVLIQVYAYEDYDNEVAELRIRKNSITIDHEFKIPLVRNNDEIIEQVLSFKNFVSYIVSFSAI